ncbi:hypothetical protein Tco_0370014 [Tanacetum coccineum]
MPSHNIPFTSTGVLPLTHNITVTGRGSSNLFIYILACWEGASGFSVLVMSVIKLHISIDVGWLVYVESELKIIAIGDKLPLILTSSYSNRDDFGRGRGRGRGSMRGRDGCERVQRDAMVDVTGVVKNQKGLS